MKKFALVILPFLSSCAVVYVDDGSGGMGGGSSSTDTSGCVPVTEEVVANKLGVECQGCEQKPLDNTQVVTLLMDYTVSEGLNFGYYPPLYPSFQDTKDEKVEMAVFSEIVLPSPYDGTAKFLPNKVMDSCELDGLVSRVKALPTQYIVPVKDEQDFTDTPFSEKETVVMTYEMFGDEQIYWVRLVNDPSNQFISGTPTNAVDKVYVRCESGEFLSVRMVVWPLDGSEVIEEAPENCWNHGDGVRLILSVTPGFEGEAVIGLHESSPVRKWTNWQDSFVPAKMTVME